MNKKITIARLLLGGIITLFGLNGFFHFMPMHAYISHAGQFITGLGAAGYFFPFLKLTETSCGLLLLSNKKVPLALIILAPILINIILFHLFLTPEGLPIPLILGGLELYLISQYKDKFTSILTN